MRLPRAIVPAMKPARRLLTRPALLTCAGALLAVVSCSGADFSSAESSGGSTAPQAGRTSGGGKATAGSGGLPTNKAGSASGGHEEVKGGGGAALDSGGSNDGGGMAPTGCDCPAGRYCRDGSTDCFDCAELSRLRFETPERLAALSDGSVVTRSPRVGLTATDLVYHIDGVGLRYTTDASTSAGGNVKATVPEDSAPLMLKSDVKAPQLQIAAFNFLFDRPSTTGPRAVFIGAWKTGLGATVEALPAPYNSGKGDYSMALAPHASTEAARAFWMTTRDAMSATLGPVLVTAQLAPQASPALVTLNVGQAGCTPKDMAAKADPDLTPWVTDDGTLLLISTTRVDGDCASTSQGKDIYTTLLQPASGQPTTAALPLSDVNSSADDVDPSFSADLCDLYFSSNRDGKFALYRAHRR